jgi:hypothetical protein
VSSLHARREGTTLGACEGITLGACEGANVSPARVGLAVLGASDGTTTRSGFERVRGKAHRSSRATRLLSSGSAAKAPSSGSP